MEEPNFDLKKILVGVDNSDDAQKAGVQDVQGIISEGNPSETIVEDVIPKYHPDLLIIGSLDIKGPKKIFGSQAAAMAKHSPISVLVVR